MTQLLKTREVILAKIETTYGVDPGLSASTNAVMVENSQWTYEGARMHERVPVRPSLGKLKPIFGGSLFQVTFDVECKGSGVAGTAPELGVLLRACAMAESIVAVTSVTYKPTSTPSSQESLTIYYYSDGTWHALTGAKGTFSFSGEVGAPGKFSFTFVGHTKMRGAVQSATSTTVVLPSTFSSVDNTYNGRTIKITSGTGAGLSKTISAYTGSSKTCTVSSWGTTPDSTSVFEIDNGPIDLALVSPTFNATLPVPLIAMPFLVDSYAAVITKLTFDSGNEVAKPGDVSGPDGFGTLMITGRKPAGSIDPEMTLVATQNYIGKWKSGAAMALSTGNIGSTAGNIYAVTMPAITYTGATKGDRDKISTLEMPFMAAESSGDDEISIAFT